MEIRVLSPQKILDPNAEFAYWVGVDLSNDAFIQVGYIWSSDIPRWFWEYFPPGNAQEATNWKTQRGSVLSPNGTWVKFALEASGTVWFAYVNGQNVGSVDLQQGSGYRVSAIAEVAGTKYTYEQLGPVEFRNLEYRDSSSSWHNLETASAYVGYGVGSAHPDVDEPYYMFAKVGVNNYWLAGSELAGSTRYCDAPMQTSELCMVQRHGIVWPWFNVQVVSQFGNTSGSGWYRRDDLVVPQADVQVKSISSQERLVLTDWSAGYRLITNGYALEVTSDMTLTAVYANQFFVNVTSPFGQVSGSGWYNQGSNVSVKVTPYSIPAQGVLGLLHVGTVFEGWTGDFSGSMNPSSLTVDSPKHIVAVWGTDYGLLPLLIGVIIAVLVIFGALALVSRRECQLSPRAREPLD